jgi:succinoglycan biosynthesis protein ExoW
MERQEGVLKASVIVPFFQHEPGILSRALRSVYSQHIPAGWSVEVIVVDDASPCPADNEMRDLAVGELVHVKVIRQENGGVAAARNRGLEETDQTAAVIAFLDSDDIWPANHLARAIQAIDSGFDFYFTDNRRAGHHDSYIVECAPNTLQVVASAWQETGVVEIPQDEVVGLIVKEFPTQASTVVYKRGQAAALRFNTTLKAAGEDVLFFAMLAASAHRVGFDLESAVECGAGLNMYFANFGWDSPKCMAIRVDQILAHRLIGKMVSLSPKSKRMNDAEVTYYRREFAFHVLRNLVKHPTRVPKEIARLFRSDAAAAIMLPGDMLRVAFGQVVGLYSGKRKE